MKISLIILVFLWILAAPVLARKKLPVRQAQSVVNNSLPQTTLKLRADNQAILLVLTNLASAKIVDYLLTYETNGVGQGVEGSYDPAGGNTQKELVLGTCSGTVCTYHQNLTNILFQVTIGLKDGQTLVRKYQVKL